MGPWKVVKGDILEIGDIRKCHRSENGVSLVLSDKIGATIKLQLQLDIEISADKWRAGKLLETWDGLEVSKEMLALRVSSRIGYQLALSLYKSIEAESLI